MVSYVIYGKIIIDDIRLATGEVARGVLGGGGPQAAFGARIWDDSVGLLTRSGIDVDQDSISTLDSLMIDLSGWKKFDQFPTARGIMAYDQNEYVLTDPDYEDKLRQLQKTMGLLLEQVLPIPDTFKAPKVIHLITEYSDEPMVHEAQSLQANGSIFSLEPLIDYRHWSNKKDMLELITKADIVTPDWPSASGIADSDNPFDVLKYWIKLGPSLVAIRHGMKGSYVWDRIDDQIYHIPIIKTEAIDPTGCGNGYGGGLAVGWSKNYSGRIAGCCGTISASFIARTVGVPPLSIAQNIDINKMLSELMDRTVVM